MAVYRERRRPIRLPLVLAGAAILIVLGLAAVLLGTRQPAGATPRQRAQAALQDVREALDLFTIEYPKQAAGQPSGASPALTRARQAFDRARPDLTAVDPAAATSFDGTLHDLESQAAAKAAPAAVVAAATQLRERIGTWIGRP